MTKEEFAHELKELHLKANSCQAPYCLVMKGKERLQIKLDELIFFTSADWLLRYVVWPAPRPVGSYPVRKS